MRKREKPKAFEDLAYQVAYLHWPDTGYYWTVYNAMLYIPCEMNGKTLRFRKREKAEAALAKFKKAMKGCLL